MKRITDNLRFSRQSSADTHMVHLSPIVQEVLTLCEYDTRTSKLQVEIDIAPTFRCWRSMKMKSNRSC